MNTKFILIFFIACNILSAIFSFGCTSSGAICNVGGGGVITTFLLIDPAINFLDLGGITVSENFTDASTAMVTPFSGGTSSPTTGFTVFLDSVKMVLGIVTLLTPVPLIDYMASLGFPYYVNIILMPMLIVMYLIGMAEFIRGGNLGR